MPRKAVVQVDTSWLSRILYDKISYTFTRCVIMEKNKRAYYVTWSAQDKATTFNFTGSRGKYFYSYDQKIWDCLSTSSQSIFGHSEEKIKGAIKKQIDTFCVASPKADTADKQIAAEGLLELLGMKGKIFYTVSGAESVENALKMARQVTGRNYILARSVSYHGATLGALSVTGDWRHENHLSLTQYTVRIPEPYDDPTGELTRRIVETQGPEKFAAFCLETISGISGVIIPPLSWWKTIQSLCDEYGIKLIVDEVFTGFGRTGKPFAFHHFPEIRPDFVTMSKSITGGYIPFGAVYTSMEIFRYYKKHVLSCGLTNYGHPLGLAALKAVLEIFKQPGFQHEMEKKAAYFDKKIEELKSQFKMKETRHIGFLAFLKFAKMRNFNQQIFIDEGLYLHAKKDVIVLAPPVIWKEDDYDRVFEKITKVLKDYYEKHHIPKCG